MQRRQNRQQHGQICCRFGNFDAAYSIDKDILIKGHNPRMPMQDRKQHGQTRAFEPDTKAFRVRRMRRINQGLNFDQQWSCPLLGRHHAGTCNTLIVLGQKQG